MPSAISRAALLRGKIRGENGVVRPPWAVPENLFTELCNGCGDCIAACPEDILTAGRGRLPEVAFEKGGCTFCEDCARACTRAAFRATDEAPWTLRATVDQSCLSLQGVACRICEEQCEARAIRFRPLVGGAARPEISHDRCTGCGTCVAVCPSRSISIASSEMEGKAA